ncbi:hypothetical protein CUMW_231040 [Citrus unshiu]|nr:hypothetical protein CUMW_231040 [Citrus unshiu]
MTEIQTCGKPIDSLLEKVLCMNILSSDYFKELYRLKTYHEVIDEIYNQVDHVEPWMTGNCRGPSTAFCLLYKFFTMKLTVKQMHGLLKHPDSPYIRAAMFTCWSGSEECGFLPLQRLLPQNGKGLGIPLRGPHLFLEWGVGVGLPLGEISTENKIGFLYLRYAADPKTLWNWFEQYLKDEECESLYEMGKMTANVPAVCESDS